MLVLIALSIASIAQATFITYLLVNNKHEKKRQFSMRQFIRAEEERLNRLTNRVNREIGVAQDVPLCDRLAALPIDEGRLHHAKAIGATVQFSTTEFNHKINDLLAVVTPESFNRVRSLAEGASMICEGLVPDSGIKAHSFDGDVVVTGMPVKG